MSIADLGRGIAGETPSEALPAARRRVVERRDAASRERLVRRVIAEFREMPCLRLTHAEASRLFGLRPDVSARIITALVAEGVLGADDDGRYAARQLG
jgi:hypothetical protein